MDFSFKFGGKLLFAHFDQKGKLQFVPKRDGRRRRSGEESTLVQ